MSIEIRTLRGTETQSLVNILAEMRVNEFCNFPYLYSGNAKDDADYYCSGYPDEHDSMLIGAYNGNEIVGICSGLPFSSNMNFLKDWISQAQSQGIDASKSYYLGELIVLPAYRKLGIADKILSRFFNSVIEMNYPNIVLVTAIRPDDHSLRPVDYVDTDNIWLKRGFSKLKVTLSIEYPTHQADGSVKDNMNVLALWQKKL